MRGDAEAAAGKRLEGDDFSNEVTDDQFQFLVSSVRGMLQEGYGIVMW